VKTSVSEMIQKLLFAKAQTALENKKYICETWVFL